MFVQASITLRLLSVALAQTLDASKYPGIDQLAAAREEWTSAITSIPDLPLRTANAISDWSKDITKCTDNTAWGLTFDDGPGPFTDTVVNALNANNVKGTFFVVGSRLMENAATLKRAHEAGHQIAIHTWSHPYLTTLSNGQIIAEIVYTAMAIKEIIGVTPKAFRPPYGDVDDRVRAIAKALDLDIIIWNADVNDFELGTASATNSSAINTIVDRFRQIASQAVKQGTISLEHDLYAVPSQAGVQVIPMIAGAGYTIQSISECTKLPAYSENFWAKLKIPAPQPLIANKTTTQNATKTSTTPTPTGPSIPSLAQRAQSSAHEQIEFISSSLYALSCAFCALLMF